MMKFVYTCCRGHRRRHSFSLCVSVSLLHLVFRGILVFDYRMVCRRRRRRRVQQQQKKKIDQAERVFVFQRNDDFA